MDPGPNLSQMQSRASTRAPSNGMNGTGGIPASSLASSRLGRRGPCAGDGRPDDAQDDAQGRRQRVRGRPEQGLAPAAGRAGQRLRGDEGRSVVLADEGPSSGYERVCAAPLVPELPQLGRARCWRVPPRRRRVLVAIFAQPTVRRVDAAAAASAGA